MSRFQDLPFVNLVAGELTKGSVFTTFYRGTELHIELEELQVCTDTHTT